LAERGVNILAILAITEAGRGTVRLVVDNAAPARNVFETSRRDYSEADVALVSLPHRPGELARAAAKLGEHGINIQHLYSGLDSRTNTPVLIFGVADAGAAAKLLEQAAAASAGN
jgi:hypothetical protein